MPRLQPDGKPTRERILSAAAELVGGTAGMDGFTMDAVAARANVSKATLYHHFDGREDLLAALAAAGFGEAGLAFPDRRREILDAALKLFARQGFHATTMDEIAGDAGITKGAIYWYFKSKHALFESVLVELSPLIGEVADPEALMDRPAEEVLLDLARTYFGTFNSPTAVRLFRLLVGEVARRPEEGDLFAQSGIMVAVSFIADYLHRQVELGRLRPHDTRSSARAFLGSLVIYVMGRELFPLIGTDPSDAERYMQEVVGIFVNGLRA